eukprot:1157938-Pelagomonas_calceolata.AAC.5
MFCPWAFVSLQSLFGTGKQTDALIECHLVIGVLMVIARILMVMSAADVLAVRDLAHTISIFTSSLHQGCA